MTASRRDGDHARAPRDRKATRRPAGIGIAALLLALVGVFVWSAVGGDDDRDPSSGAASGEPAELVALSVTGSPNALLAVVGAGGSIEPAALVLPTGMAVVAPGQGETTTQEIQALPEGSMQVAVSNTVGAWAEHEAVLGLEDLEVAIDRAGGVSVELPEAVTVGDVVLGPGASTMDGAQVIAYLSEPVDDASLRWALVLDALLDELPLEAEDLEHTDDAEAVIDLLRRAEGAVVDIVPTQVVGGTTAIPAQPDLDTLMGQMFSTPVPTPVLVQNGSGEPGVGEAVAARIIPEAFRVVLSQNAESFRHDVTEITATGPEHLDDAELIRGALGTGEVQVTQVPSGLADVLIVVGKDFEG